MMKERAKLYKSQKNRTVHTLAKRLQAEEEKEGELSSSMGGADKKKKMNDGSAMVISNPPQIHMQFGLLQR